MSTRNLFDYAPIFLLLFLGLCTFTPAVRASTLTVTSGADSGHGSLREAVLRASSGDTIVFDPAVTTIVLTSGEIVIKKALVIQGPGANVLSITANAASRIFRISGSFKVILADMTLERGNSADRGGAILNDGALLLRRMFVKRNSAMHGGAVYSTGSIKVEASTIYLNEAQFGGGISVGPTADSAEFTNSTVSQNTATNDDGGGVTSRSRLLFVTHCTIVQNKTLATYAAGGLHALASQTFLTNSIIADNLSAQFNDAFGVINSQGTNIVGDPNGNAGQWDVTDLLSANPSLGPLQYNNGGTTPTYAPTAGSPAIDAGDESSTTPLDQNGAPRLRGMTVDIGSLEAQPIAQTITVQNSNDSGPGSFREAVANSQPGGIINFVTNHVHLTSLLPINKDLIITGPGANALLFTSNQFRELHILSGSRVRISGLKFGGFGGIVSFGDLYVTDVSSMGSLIFYSGPGSLTLNNSQFESARGIEIQGGKLIVNNSSISRNFFAVSPYGGGGIYFNGTVGRIRNTTIAQNRAAAALGYRGGGIYVEGGYLALTNSTIAENYVDTYGGAMYVKAGANASLTNCTVTGNQTGSGNSAGGIYSNSNVQLKNTIVAGNLNPWNSGEKDVGGYIISSGHNLIGYVGTSSGYDSTDLLNVNPLLLPLANYGGPTQTVALQSGSPATDAGDNYLAPPTDQRAITRLFAGNTVDIGAYEYP